VDNFIFLRSDPRGPRKQVKIPSSGSLALVAASSWCSSGVLLGLDKSLFTLFGTTFTATDPYCLAAVSSHLQTS
jgi:hypothetical protein